MLKLNIGCGNLPIEGFKNVDISKEAKADEVYDLTKGIPEENGSCNEVNAGCVLEQIDSNKDFMFVMNEVYRVLCKGGVFTGYVPSTHPDVMYLDQMDKRFFKQESFDYFDKTKHHWQEFGRVYGFKGWSSAETLYKSNHIIHFKLTK